MDSVSQFALGAAIGEATLGARLGRKAMLLGGLLGTLPDMDVLVQYADAVESFTYHRSWSHSLFVLGLVSIPIAWLLMRYFPASWLNDKYSGDKQGLAVPYRHWFTCVFLVLVTHPVLDGFTIYGTQLLWPLPVQPIAWGSIFIIDPLYTLPLIIGLLVAYRHRTKAKKAVITGLLVSTTYLGVTLLLQSHVRAKSIDALSAQNVSAHNVLVAPTPLSVLWRVVSMDGNQYHEGFTSLLDKSDEIRFIAYDTNRELIDAHAAHWPVSRLDWFTNQMISASRIADELVINDLRMGIESSYIFRFAVGRWNSTEFEPIVSRELPVEIDVDRMKLLLKRLVDESIILEPH